MGRINAILKDLDADRSTRGKIRKLLSKEQWDEMLLHYDRGVSAKAIFAACGGNIVPFFSSDKQLLNAITAEKNARRKAAAKR